MPSFSGDRRSLIVGIAGLVGTTANGRPPPLQGPATAADRTPAAAGDQDVILRRGVTSITRPLMPAKSSIIRGVSREGSLVRRIGPGPVYSSRASFVTYLDQTIDRADSAAGTGIVQWSVDGGATPLEGFKVLRCNISGHATGIDLKDIVLGSIEDSYIQSCGVGVRIASSAIHPSTMIALRQSWLRENTTLGLDVVGVSNLTIDQVAFEKCAIGAKFAGCSAVLLLNSWWERNARSADIVNCQSTAWNGGSVDGAALVSKGAPAVRQFYFNNDAVAGTHIFDGAWRIDNLGSRIFATADRGATIVVRSPDLIGVAWQALNGGKIIFDLLVSGNRTLESQRDLAIGGPALIDVPGLLPGDWCEAWLYGNPDRNGPVQLSGQCVAPGKVQVTLQEIASQSRLVGPVVVTVIGRKRPIASIDPRRGI